MAPTSRVSAIVSRAPIRSTSQSSYTCLRCQLISSKALQRSSASLIYLPSRRHASDLIDTEKWRKRIWGTDNPPGYQDPYAGPRQVDGRVVEHLVEEPESASSDEMSEKEVLDLEEGVAGDADYERATTWDGLLEVGHSTWGKEQFSAENPFKGFMDPKLESRETIITAVHRAFVEVFTLKQAGLPLVMDYDAGDTYLEDVNGFLLQLAKEAKFEIDVAGDWRLVLGNPELEEDILASITPRDQIDEEEEEDEEDEEDEEQEEEEDEEEAKEGQQDDVEHLEGREKESDTREREHSEKLAQKEEEDPGRQAISSSAVEPQAVETESTAVFDPSQLPSADEPPTASGIPDHLLLLPEDRNWRNVSLENSEIKFAVLKRVMQLTGIRIPDPIIADIKNPKLLLSHLMKKPTPKKLVETLLANEAADLPNVKIWNGRYTYVHKEQEIGRWKIIEQELEKRGLPIPGRRTDRNSLELRA